MLEQKDPVSHDSRNKKSMEAINSRIGESVILIERVSKSPTTSNLILGCLRNTFMLYNLTDTELDSIRNHMFYCEVKEGDYVFRAGSQGHCFFIVERGSLELLVDDVFKKEIKPSDGFGEIALLYATERISSVRAREDCELWAIDRQTFRETVEEVIVRDFQENRKCLQNTRFFTGLTREQKDELVASLLVKRIARNQTIIKEGDPGSCFYYIKEGNASAYKGNKFIKKLMKGDTFGEQSLYYNTIRQLTVKADEECLVLILSRDTLNKVMGDRVYEITFKNFIRWSLENSNYLERLNSTQIDQLIDHMKLSSFKSNETIFRKGVMGFQKFVVVIEGQLKSLKNGAIVATKGSCLGEEFFFEENRVKTMEDEIVMNSYGVLAELIDYKIIESMGLHKLSAKASSNDEIEKLVQYFPPNQRKSELESVKLSDVEISHKLREGQFGPLYAAKKNKDMYCIKSFLKKQLQEYEVEDFINNEAALLSSLSHPLIVAIGPRFHTPNIAFYLGEYLEGTEFYEVLKIIGILSTQDSRFYAANIICILEYLHSQLIISRDIKPENFIVTTQGSLVLHSLSVAKRVKKEQREWGRTYTIIGTPHYMAPDIILGRGYSNMVDLWSLGIMIFEFMAGYLPYGDLAEGAYEIYEDIMQNQLKFPEFFSDKKAKKIIEQLLSHNPESRLDGSFSRLKSHSWFEGIDWKAISERRNSGYVPFKSPSSAPPSSSMKDSGKKLEHLARELDKYPEVKHKENEQKWKHFGHLIR